MSDEAAAATTAEQQKPPQESAAAAAASEAEKKPDEASPAPAAAAAAAEGAKQKEKEEKERAKREKEEQRKREAEEKKRAAEEKKRQQDEEKKAKAEAKAKAKAAATTESKSCGLGLAIDIANRDKNQINCHINVQFEDIIAEPDPTVFSFDNVWTTSFKVFTTTKLWCYRIISLLCAVPAAICWGIEFALLSFCTIWCWQPSLKAMDISLWYTRRIYEILLKVFVEPCFHAAGKCLSHVVVTVRREV